jgi:hypothetical protein
MKKVLLAALFLAPLLVSASTLSAPQVNSIILLLRAFGVSDSVVSEVYADLAPQNVTSAPIQTVPVQTTPVQSTPIQSNLYGSVTPTCIPNPVLTLTVATSSIDSSNRNPTRSETINATYQTGCTLSSNTPVNFAAQYLSSPPYIDDAGNKIDHNEVGLPSNLQQGPVTLGQDYPVNAILSDTSWTFTGKYLETPPVLTPITYTLTIDGVTQSVTIQ